MYFHNQCLFWCILFYFLAKIVQVFQSIKSFIKYFHSMSYYLDYIYIINSSILNVLTTWNFYSIGISNDYIFYSAGDSAFYQKYVVKHKKFFSLFELTRYL